jgi:hypothetical protein
LFLLTKSPRYYYDGEAIKEPQSEATLTRFAAGQAPRRQGPKKTIAKAWEVRANADFGTPAGILNGGRNKRSVWTIATAPFPGAHFATFPPKLIEPCILAGTSERGVCPKCEAPWARVTKQLRPEYRIDPGTHGTMRPDGNGMRMPDKFNTKTETIGWRPTCSCNAGDPVPATVLDCFGGAGTTGLVADRRDRNAILVELSSAYAEMTRRRLGLAAPSLAA